MSSRSLPKLALRRHALHIANPLPRLALRRRIPNTADPPHKLPLRRRATHIARKPLVPTKRCAEFIAKSPLSSRISRAQARPKFQEFRRRKATRHACLCRRGPDEFRATAVPYPMPASAKGRVDHQIQELHINSQAPRVARPNERGEDVRAPSAFRDAFDAVFNRAAKIASTRLDRGPWRSTERSWTLWSVTSVRA